MRYIILGSENLTTIKLIIILFLNDETIVNFLNQTIDFSYHFIT